MLKIPTQERSGIHSQQAIGYHRWSNLLFVHWRMPADVVAASLPRQLEIDTWDGDAWIGLVLFQMSGVRPWWSCPLPWLSKFPETNVRTYVRFRGSEPAVWFLSLEAGNPAAVWLARRGWGLNYYWAKMAVERRGHSIRYVSRRHGSAPHIGTDVAAKLGSGRNSSATFLAQPDTLEHFLVERYALYTQAADGRLLQAHVRHVPYPLQSAKLIRCDESLIAAAGLPAPDEPPCHAVFCPGVEVDILPLTSVN